MVISLVRVKQTVMSNRESTLRQLTTEIREHEAIEDAFLAKSFTDRLVIIDVSNVTNRLGLNYVGVTFDSVTGLS